MTASKDSIVSAWISFLRTQPTRVYIFDLWNFTTATGIDDFVSLLKQNNVTPIVITRLNSVPDLGDLMSYGRYPTDLPAFNIEPGSDITGAELVNAAHDAGVDIAGSASEFDLDDTSMADATIACGASVFAYSSNLTFPPKLPAGVHRFAHFIQADFNRSPRHGMQQQQHLPMTDERQRQQELDHSQRI